MSRQSDQVANWSSMAKEPLGDFSAGASGVDFALDIFERTGCAWEVDAERCVLLCRCRPVDDVVGAVVGNGYTGKKTPGGAGRHTGHTSAHADTRRTQTNLTSIQTQRHTRTTARDSRNPKPRPTQQQQEQPQARSRPLPTADSERPYRTGNKKSQSVSQSVISRSRRPRSPLHRLSCLSMCLSRLPPVSTGVFLPHTGHAGAQGHTDHTPATDETA